MNLSLSTLTSANPPLTLNHSAAQVGIVHLGFGAFHRAHQALITDTYMQEFGGNWKIVGVTWGSSDLPQKMAQQDNLYTVGVGYNDTLNVQLISAIEEILTSTQTDQVFAYMCSPDVKIVSLTITEKGYCHHPATGDLDLNHPFIQHDLADPTHPQSAVGFLVEALNIRRQKGIAPFTPLTCDNLPENGHVLEKVVLQFAQARDPELHQWIKNHIQFPCTMVDRIVPRTTENDISRVEQVLGLRDEACVVTEPFLQWVVEDKFVNDRPLWENTSIANIEVTDNVLPFEEMKLRLLNGTHSSMAYLGYLSGYQTIAETIRDPKFKYFIRRMMDDTITPAVHIQGVDLDDYKSQLIERYENTALQHRTWQIAMDGSQKVPQRFLQTMRYGLDHHVDLSPLYLALAGWIRYVSGIDEQHQAIDVQDPLRDQFAAIWEQHKDQPQAIVNAFVHLDSVFSPEFAHDNTFIESLTEALETIMTLGSKQAVYQWVSTHKN
ncbi:mannitol dehydrogenase family protein [Vibrio nitrifigilis]|uniref:Mannitol dehydrogenase family protein n=1 Tax=Vibrio nitrifigilis TaxID=2789781 RepID=A0ABS0GLQ8_9VIBR|nr:mannitol dehydrogenase family protein [Vibrio nitrifigilis]MBF9003399.1 mannitol dehydrogenase family protein [Vibrio nitrifigilis]